MCCITLLRTCTASGGCLCAFYLADCASPVLLLIWGEHHGHVPGRDHLWLLCLAVSDMVRGLGILQTLRNSLRFWFSVSGDCNLVPLAAPPLVLVVGVELGAHKWHLGAGVPHLVVHGALGVALVLPSLLCLEAECIPILYGDCLTGSLSSTNNI